MDSFGYPFLKNYTTSRRDNTADIKNRKSVSMTMIPAISMATYTTYKVVLATISSAVGLGAIVIMTVWNIVQGRKQSIQRIQEKTGILEELLAGEEDRMAGKNGCTLDELDAYLDDVIAEV